jgi:hypothetical protein
MSDATTSSSITPRESGGAHAAATNARTEVAAKVHSRRA